MNSRLNLFEPNGSRGSYGITVSTSLEYNSKHGLDLNVKDNNGNGSSNGNNGNNNGDLGSQDLENIPDCMYRLSQGTFLVNTQASSSSSTSASASSNRLHNHTHSLHHGYSQSITAISLRKVTGCSSATSGKRISLFSILVIR